MAVGLSGCFGGSSSSGGGSSSTPGNGPTVELERLEISPSTIRLSTEETEQLAATAFYSDGTSEDVTADTAWAVDDTDLAEFDAGTPGLLIALAAGETTVSGEFEGVSGTAELVVDENLASELRLGVLRIELPAGTSEQLTATAVFQDGSTENVTNDAAWAVGDDTVAALDEETAGLLRAIQVGETGITVDYQGLSVTAEVKVLPGALESLRIEPEGPLELFRGGKQQLRALAMFEGLADARDVTRDTAWSSDDESVATVGSDGDQTGVLEGVGAGAADITASFNPSGSDITRTDTVSVTVEEIVAGQTLHIDAPTDLDQGAVVQLTANLNGEDVTGQVQWSSSDDEVLRFLDPSDRPGLAAGFAPGNVTVSAGLGDELADQPIEIVAAPNAPRSLNLSATPNVILADNSDATDLEALVRANQEGAPLSPEREVEFVVRGGQNILFDAQATTSEGRATVEFRSDTVGFFLVDAQVDGTLAEDSVPIAVVEDFGQIIARAKGIVEPPELDGPAVLVVLFNLSNRDFLVEEIRLIQGTETVGTISGDDLVDNTLPGRGLTDALVEIEEGMDLSDSRLEFDLLDERTGTSFMVSVSLPTE
ncbi:MAG: Ig-like domain-containing protein [Ectothiorhodospiraceae bacterium]|nr:Ig-like domain-containing protein [Ectothiorhodospiraceae bacterium]